MQSIEILDIRLFMQLLFQTNTFDSYQFVSASIQADINYQLEGHINHKFYDNTELETLKLLNSNYISWSIAKEKIYYLIKGKKTPSRLKIILRVSETETNNLCSNSNSSLNPNDIDGLFLNITFEENKLNVICGISYKIFTIDKSIENNFSESIITLFKSKNITCL